MPMYDTFLFRCAICDRDIRDYPGRNGRDRHLKPICLSCEHRWTERVGKPAGGSFMDRRKAMQIVALVEALHSSAASIKWSSSYDYA